MPDIDTRKHLNLRLKTENVKNSLNAIIMSAVKNRCFAKMVLK